MSTKKPPSLPHSLSYLQPFVNALAKLPPEQLNEDVDASRLDSALRKRVRGLELEATTLKDQFPHADVRKEFINREDDDAVYTVQVVPGEFNLHERWRQWVKEFSDSPRP
jgi:hypothetical protein